MFPQSAHAGSAALQSGFNSADDAGGDVTVVSPIQLTADSGALPAGHSATPQVYQ